MRTASLLACLLIPSSLVGFYIGTREWDLATVIVAGAGAGTLLTLIALVALMSLRRPPEDDAPAVR